MIAPPSARTLAKYGLTSAEWLAILERQGGVCAVCRTAPKTGRLVIDHAHVPGWRRMPPEKRKLHIRGLLCWYDNHRFVSKGITIAKARAVVEYLLAHEARLIEAGLGRAA